MKREFICLGKNQSISFRNLKTHLIITLFLLAVLQSFATKKSNLIYILTDRWRSAAYYLNKFGFHEMFQHTIFTFKSEF